LDYKDCDGCNLVNLQNAYNVAGVWPEGADGTDINSVGRSNNGKFLASGDDFGKVHLFKYPAVQPRVSESSFEVSVLGTSCPNVEN